MLRKGKQKKAKRWLDIYVIFSISACLIYTAIVLVIFAFTGQEPTQLTIGFFGLFGGEVLAAALIKIFNIRNDNTNESEVHNGTDDFTDDPE